FSKPRGRCARFPVHCCANASMPCEYCSHPAEPSDCPSCNWWRGATAWWASGQPAPSPTAARNCNASTLTDRISCCRPAPRPAPTPFWSSLNACAEALPTEGLFQERDGQLALRLQGRLIQLFKQFEQAAGTARATGENEAANIIRQLQSATRRPQLQGPQFVLVRQQLQLEHQRLAQPRAQVRQLYRQCTRRGVSCQQQPFAGIAQAVE